MQENQVTKIEENINLPFSVPTLNERAAEQLNGIKMEYPQLKIPAAGQLFFEVDDEPVKEVTGVIVYHGPRNMYYATDFDGSNNPPDCSSNDGVTGYKRIEVDDGEAEYEKCNCAECEFSKFGSDRKGAGKACKEKHQLYVLCSGKLVPFSFLLPVSSTGVFNTYVTKLFSRGKFVDEVLTSITLEKATSKSNIVYSKIILKCVRDLTPEECEVAQKQGKIVKENLQ